ncbi:MAG: stage II sporulation protein M [Actinomycetota bacterium]|nr:stage II sporulation protein M [Actinomycetota bacterium]
MDLDAYVAAHHGEWERLRELGGRGRLTAAEADELLDLYQRVATHLSQIRSTAADPALVRYLSAVLSRARAKSMGGRTSTWAGVARFFAATFPAVLYRLRRWWLGVLVSNVVAAFAVGAWVAQHPGVQTSFISAKQANQLVDKDFAGYYTEYAATDFATRVWTNNVWVAALCIAFGVLGLPVIYLLFQNVMNVAIIGGLMASHGKLSLFFGLILPHGMLELTAVFVAAGAGLKLFWSWIEPGGRTRMDAMAAEGRAVITVAMGLVVVLLVTGIIEAFVTPSGLPTGARIGIGAAAEVLFFLYVFIIGRRAWRDGDMGEVAEIDRSATLPTAA